jgi:hypothetical protein
MLICNNFEFDFNPRFIDYKNSPDYLKHNLILSLNDGLLLYKGMRNGIQTKYNIPFHYDNIFKENYIKADNEELPIHIKEFLNQYCSGISLTTTLQIDMTHYFLCDNEFTGSSYPPH